MAPGEQLLVPGGWRGSSTNWAPQNVAIYRIYRASVLDFGLEMEVYHWTQVVFLLERPLCRMGESRFVRRRRGFQPHGLQPRLDGGHIPPEPLRGGWHPRPEVEGAERPQVGRAKAEAAGPVLLGALLRPVGAQRHGVPPRGGALRRAAAVVGRRAGAQRSLAHALRPGDRVGGKADARSIQHLLHEGVAGGATSS